jgi:arsenite-transporting ATPase
MTLILTFLGKGGTGRTTLAIAAAKQLAAQGNRVLLGFQDTSPTPGILLETQLSPEPQILEANLWVQQLRATTLLEHSWEELKNLEAEYLRTPFFTTVYGQELGVLPGMDSALALNFLRQQSQTQTYDVIIHDGLASQETLRMWGMPDILAWYIRRFRQVFLDSDVGKALLPFVQPVTAAVLNVSWSADSLTEPTHQAEEALNGGSQAVADPAQVLAYLVTTAETTAIATAQHLWGGAQQVGLTVGGVLGNPGANPTPANPANFNPENLEGSFDPLPLAAIPPRNGSWQPLQAALPNFQAPCQAPRSISVHIDRRQIQLFLPGFDKKQVKLTQYGPELTIEAGDQRRNIFLPPELEGQPVVGAKFQSGYLTITLG